jgi:DNA-binding transcriptional LysR family regulator
MKPNQLHAFVAVADQLSIRGAARALAVTPPAVTKIVRDLEQAVGAALVERSVKGVALTEAGAAFAPRARLLLADMRRAREEIAQISRGITGTVSIAVTSAFALTLLPAAFKAFHAQYPAVHVVFDESVLASMLAGLQDGRLDFAVAHVAPGRLDPDFEQIQLFRSRLVIGVRRYHPLRRSRSIHDFYGQEWVVPGVGSMDGDTPARLFGSIGLMPPQRVVAIESVNIALSLIREMDVVGMFSESLVPFEFKRHGMVRIDVTEPLPPMQVCIVKRRDQVLTPAARHFAACIQRVAQAAHAAG